MKVSHSHHRSSEPFFYNPDPNKSELDFVEVASSILKAVPIAESRKSISQHEFMGAIIHELKTPLNAIIGFSEVLQETIHKLYSEEECDGYVQEIIKAASDLDSLVHDLLDVGNASFGNFSVDLSKEINVGEVIKRSIKLNYGYAVRGQITIQSEISENIPTIKLDEKRTKQILTNLISNAVKYSPQKTEIKISTKSVVKNGNICLQIIVSDQGFGMTQEQIKAAFQEYKTIQNPNSDKVDSFGMGLPIVKRLVELQRGEMEVKSDIGKGTVVTLEFPTHRR